MSQLSLDFRSPDDMLVSIIFQSKNGILEVLHKVVIQFQVHKPGYPPACAFTGIPENWFRIFGYQSIQEAIPGLASSSRMQVECRYSPKQSGIEIFHVLHAWAKASGYRIEPAAGTLRQYNLIGLTP